MQTTPSTPLNQLECWIWGQECVVCTDMMPWITHHNDKKKQKKNNPAAAISQDPAEVEVNPDSAHIPRFSCISLLLSNLGAAVWASKLSTIKTTKKRRQRQEKWLMSPVSLSKRVELTLNETPGEGKMQARLEDSGEAASPPGIYPM